MSNLESLIICQPQPEVPVDLHKTSCSTPLVDIYMSDANTHSESGPYLPIELERLIFELAVSENGTKASIPLLLIAKRVNEWIKPLIFRVINQLRKLHGPSLAPRFVPSAGHFVQHLIIDYLCIDNLTAILSSCPNLCSLAIWGCPTDCPFPAPLQQMPYLTHLLAPFSVVWYSFLIQSCSNLTHLDILNLHFNSWEGEWEVVTHLPKLTHIAVSVGCIPCGFALKFLLFCPILKLLIVAPYSFLRQSFHFDRVDDNRLVLLKFMGHDDLVYDWEKGANGGVDMWVFSELIVFARDKKYFLPSRPRWILRNLDWEANLNEDGRKWFSELRLNEPLSGDL